MRFANGSEAGLRPVELRKLGGGAKGFADVSGDISVAPGSASLRFRRAPYVIEGMPEEMSLDVVTELDPERAERIRLPNRSSEIYHALALKTGGDAKFLVKSLGG